MIALLSLCAMLAVCEGKEVKYPKETESQKQTEDPQNYEWPYDAMSSDWGGEEMEGFQLYQIPNEYIKTGGKLPEVVQVYTFCLCREYGVDYSTVLAIIQTESGFCWEAQSQSAFGYMQVIPSQHQDRIQRLSVEDIKNPYGNIRVGVDYLAELLQKYDGDYHKALTAYRWGPTGANRKYFSKGEEKSKYSKAVTKTAQRIRAEIEKE